MGEEATNLSGLCYLPRTSRLLFFLNAEGINQAVSSAHSFQPVPGSDGLTQGLAPARMFV